MRRLGVATIAAALTAALAPGSASAGVLRAESILPPGQSGFVSIAGVASGSGSPHLYDQQPLFIDFRRKPALFGQPGTEEVPRAGVRIVRDGFGVPAISGDSDTDVWWGAGYAVAQDRLFELELFRRATTGRLAEILGRGYLDDDLIARRDYYTGPELDELAAALPAQFRARFEAYRDGVNAWIAHVRANGGDMPGEFVATNAPLDDWTLRDSIAIGIFLARTVPSGDGNELLNLQTLRAIGPRSFERIVPLRVARQVVTVPPENGAFPSQPGRTPRRERAAFRRSQRVSAAWELPGLVQPSADRRSVAAGMIGQVGGSYMVAVRRRRDRHAFLFNGPQLGFAVPELFVELELHGPGIDVRGVTAPGVPVIGIGHNGNVAWGFTSGLSDEDDLYAEQVVPGQTERYRFKGEERAMECRDERFAFNSPPTDLLGGALPESGEQVERICRTIHGPVQARARGTAYARRYALWKRELETLEGLADLNVARSVRDVDAAMRKVTWNENVIAADSQGNIGYWHPGLHPLRPLGFDERLPYPGTGEAEWRGLLDRRRTPHVINPRQGWLVNWNNVPSAGWTSGDAPASERLGGPFHRAAWLRRLARRVAKAPSFEAMEQLIHDAGTIAQQRPLAQVRLARARALASGPAAVVLDAILAWDGSYHRTAADGTVDPGVAAWDALKAQLEKIALVKLGKEAAKVAGAPSNNHQFDASNGQAYALRSLPPSAWVSAAAAAFGDLARRFGSEDPARWREPRRMYDVAAQGAGQAPPLPFFDRGTWEQVVELGP